MPCSPGFPAACGCHPAPYPQKPGKASLALETSPLVHITLHSWPGNQGCSSLVNPDSRYLTLNSSFFLRKMKPVPYRHCRSSDTEWRCKAWNPKKGCFLVVSWWSHQHTQSRLKLWRLHRVDQQWKESLLLTGKRLTHLQRPVSSFRIWILMEKWFLFSESNVSTWEEDIAERKQPPTVRRKVPEQSGPAHSVTLD